MADTVSRSSVIKVVMNFTDGDTRSLSLANPKTADELPVALGTFQTALSETHAFIGDKTGAGFSHLSDARLVNTSEVNLDLA